VSKKGKALERRKTFDPLFPSRCGGPTCSAQPRKRAVLVAAAAALFVRLFIHSFFLLLLREKCQRCGVYFLGLLSTRYRTWYVAVTRYYPAPSPPPPRLSSTRTIEFTSFEATKEESSAPDAAAIILLASWRWNNEWICQSVNRRSRRLISHQ
jgi:hypothetical protein